MSPLQMLLQDPIVLYALVGVALVVGLCGYYTWLILDRISHAPKDE